MTALSIAAASLLIILAWWGVYITRWSGLKQYSLVCGDLTFRNGSVYNIKGLDRRRDTTEIINTGEYWADKADIMTSSVPDSFIKCRTYDIQCAG